MDATRAMTAALVRRLLTEPDKRLLWKFIHNFGWKGMGAIRRFQTRVKRGEFFPAFLFISVTNRCNLSCQGCWVTPTMPAQGLDADVLDNLVAEGKKQGSHFFGILGGEPLLHDGLFDVLENHPDCYFLLFTNGTLISDEIAGRIREIGTISPLISIEGLEEVSDERRGGVDVYRRTLEGLDRCREQRLVFGVATSVCRSNIRDLATEEFVNDLAARGVHYLWYYIYRPVGPNPAPELALSADEIVELRRFLVDIRLTAPLMIVDAYWDHDGNALCPAAVGMSHHVGPGGDIEPCPPVQFARENVGDGRDLARTIGDSEFLRRFRSLCRETTQGCILLEHPERLESFLRQEKARDSSGRDRGYEELGAMTACPGHHQSGREIPEKSRVYRFAKKHWFFGFGAYG